MAIKLEKLVLPSGSEIESLAHKELIGLALNMRERIEYYQGILFQARKHRFGTSSEKSDKSKPPISTEQPKSPAPRSDTTKQLSERYPAAPIQEEKIGFSEPPCCRECGNQTQDSGMTEDSEYLTTEPREFIIVQQKRQKNRCQKCHSSIVTAPSPALP